MYFITRRCMQTLLLILYAFSSAVPTQATEWGTLSGKIIYTGKPVKPARLEITKDREVCCRGNPAHLDESFLISKQGGVKNVFVFLRNEDLDQKLIHPDYYKLPKTVPLSHKSCVFHPHATGLWYQHQKLLLSNHDRMVHTRDIRVVKNVFMSSINPVPGEQYLMDFVQAEYLPAPVQCNIHPWEQAYLLILNHPYFAITDEAGAFQIKNIPAGQWDFQFWHERAGHVVNQAGPKRGRLTLQIKPGKNDLGVIKVTPEVFERDPASKKK